MTTAALPPEIRREIEELRADVYRLQRDRAKPLYNLRDLADTGGNAVLGDGLTYATDGQVPVKRKNTGLWTAESLPLAQWSMPGAVAIAAQADQPSHTVRYPRTLVEFIATLTTAGTTTTTVHLFRNGVSIQTLNLTSGLLDGTTGVIAVVCAAGDKLSVDCSAAGTGAKGLTLEARV